MKKVSIIGCPGAGKSTFARALSNKTSIPIEHLDFYNHQKEHDYENDKVSWIDKIGELTSNDSWIIEGNYGSTYEQRFTKSDTLIFMDISSWLSIWSVIKRRIQYRNKKREEMPDDWIEKIDPVFFKYVVLFRLKSRKDVVDGINKYRHNNLNVITFKTRKAAYKWLDELG
ncbi:AAA family ATPase [bacterium]|nr:AAA family ATPase [bacterium]NBX97817.1 AAA family ATPase [bacterium]NDC94529.1 AAA family ATPase [bacterium]NDD83856.1 AAA family ATPase [bacterium]NDG29935.1 AAA family ATPase [bacterium]